MYRKRSTAGTLVSHSFNVLDLRCVRDRFIGEQTYGIYTRIAIILSMLFYPSAICTRTTATSGARCAESPRQYSYFLIPNSIAVECNASACCRLRGPVQSCGGLQLGQIGTQETSIQHRVLRNECQHNGRRNRLLSD